MSDDNDDHLMSKEDIDDLLSGLGDSTHSKANQNLDLAHLTDEEQRIFTCIQNCLRDVSAGSGHLASYSLISKSFQITDKQISKDEIQIDFSCDAYLESEFDQDYPTQNLQGQIFIGHDFEVLRDESGKARISPWNSRY